MTEQEVNEYISFLKENKAIVENKNSYSGEKSKDIANCNEQLLIAISAEFERMQNTLNSIAELNEYNEQYKNYFDKRIESIKKSLESVNKITLNKYSIDNYLNLASSLAIRLIDDVSFSAFENFKCGNSNYILFGKNGSGKTTLLNKVAREMMSANSIVVPATRVISYSSDIIHNDRQINLNWALLNNEKDKSMFILSKCIISEELAQRRNNKDEDSVITNEIIETFLSLGLDRKLKISKKGELYLYNNDDCSDKYLLNSGSDGERAVLYIVMAVLLAPINSYVFIDEPENHLNGALMKKLFDKLESKRKDLIFIYATHNIPFIESRTNSKLIYLEKTNTVNKWKYREVNNFSDIPIKYILEIEGTNDDVIFCEGEKEKSLDYPLYSLLYPDYHVIPSHGCGDVIFNTRSINKYKNIFKKNAIGIIDGDFRDNTSVQDLNNKNVKVIKVNEVENLYLLGPCLKAMTENFSPGLSVDKAKLLIIEWISKNINEIKKDCINKVLRRMRKENEISDVDNFEIEFDEIYKMNKETLNNICSEYNKKFSEYIKNSDYDNLMTVVPGKKIISYVSKIFGLEPQMYVKNLLKIISLDDSIKAILKSYIQI